MENLLTLITEYAELERKIGRLETNVEQNREELIELSHQSANTLVKLQLQVINISRELLK